MLWTKQQQDILDHFISEIKNIRWFQTAGQPSEQYMVVDSVWEACDTYGKQMCEVWGKNSENIEEESLKNFPMHKSMPYSKRSVWLSGTKFTKLFAIWKIKSERKPEKINPDWKMKYSTSSNATRPGQLSNGF